ncbi:isocitrate lyase/phosphoenolpyruvate mutase family protein [Sphingosinicella sp. YJ22]|uniref:isocitrate lyase/PEP mutase family protein n=1 Tax=Sphingosinicella sp. YJ22 TaxID=1104780 RepID=UPI0014075CDB|nr:isocitrate lyase/phosphoenolpyruvate mutase family protein [Sphingosinicella sp. YJ22]
MTDHHARFAAFAALHRPGQPLILFNAWDSGSAAAIAEAGAPAIATGSWSVAAAQGFADAEALPIGLALANAERVAEAVEVPVTIDFEGAYAVDPDHVAANMLRLAGTGAVGCNFEDQLVGGEGLHPVVFQGDRIAAARNAVGSDFFINARIDLFLKAKPEQHADAMSEALERAEAYAQSGASGLFFPGLGDPGLIARLCEASPLPVNIMAYPGAPSADKLAGLGVARISHGPFPYRRMIDWLKSAAAEHYRR